MYEDLVIELLMDYRKENPYCKPNTVPSDQLRAVRENPHALA